MIWNLWKKIRKFEEHFVDTERQERVKAMKAEQISIQLELGFDPNDSVGLAAFASNLKRP